MKLWRERRPPLIHAVRHDRCGLFVPGALPYLRLLVVYNLGVVMVMTVMVMAVYDHHNLRLRRVRYREAEDESQCEQNLFHTPVLRFANEFTELL